MADMNIKTIAAVGVSWLALAGAAAAQASPVSDEERARRIEALETRLSELEAQLEDLKASSSADVAEVRRVAGDQPVVTVANGRPTIATPDGNFRFAVRGLVQYDAAHFEQDDPGTPDNRRADTANASDLSDGANFRRARFGFEGTAFRDWNYALIYELGGTGTEGSQITQAYVEYAGWKPWETAAPVRFRIGAWATPAGLEDATSNTESLFLERPSSAELIRGLAGGDGRTGVGVLANGDRWYASGAFTGATVANSGEFDEQSGYLARIAYLPLRGENYGVHIGANLTGIIEPADTDASVVDQQRVRLRERPELRNDTTRFVDTGNINADGVTAYGLEVGGFWENLYASGEVFQIDLDRRGAGTDPEFGGWYVQGAWTITKERRRWNATNGGFQGIRVVDAFNPQEDHWGAWEIAARYSVLDLNFHEGAEGSAAIAGDTVRGGEQTITSFGLNWYPNNVIRFLLNYQFVEIDRYDPENGVVANTTVFGGAPSVVGNGAQIGQDFEAISLRTQVAF
jgi:phosphate-selective porin OprO and OprP